MSNPQTPANGQLPLRRSRAVAAIAIGIACGVASFAATLMPGFRNQDFHSWWLAAHAVLDGRDPYTTIWTGTGRGFLYPLPAALATIPLSWLPSTVAGPTFVTLSCGLLAYVVTRTAWWPLYMFLSGSMLLNVVAGQWSPLLTAALFLPALSWIAVLKPNIGLAIFAYAPRLSGLVAMAAIVVASLFVMPTWPRQWIEASLASPVHFAPYTVVGGFLMLAVLVRWRRPEARMLAVLAMVPSSPIVYETLPLFVIPERRSEMVLLALLSDVLALLMMNLSIEANTAQYLRIARPAIVWLMYLPCAAMILRRPNVALPRGGPRHAWAPVDELSGAL